MAHKESEWKRYLRQHLPSLELDAGRESEIIDELAEHLDAAYEEALASGASEEEARQRAVLQISDWRLLECELSRAERSSAKRWIYRNLARGDSPDTGRKGAARMESLSQDLRFIVRTLLRTPAYTAIAVITLALGIGANTAIFSVVNSTLLSPLPFKDPERLVLLSSKNEQRRIERGEITQGDYLDFRDRSQAFDEVAAFGPWGFNITGEDDPEKITSVVVSTNLFQALGVEPIRGRAFLAGESTPGRDKVVVLSHSLWQRRYGGDENLVGRALTLDGSSYTVVGIMPPDFRFPNNDVEMWAPLDLTPDESSRRSRWLNVVARLKTGVSMAEARTEMATVAAGLERQYAETNSGWGVDVSFLREVAVKDVRLAVLLLFAAAGLVLLIACVNVANLLLARLESRQKEMAVRAALGASRGRLARLLLAETLLISLLGGAVGLLFAVQGLGLLSAFIPGGPAPGPDDLQLLRLNEINLDGRVFGFAMLASLLPGLLFGLIPAYQASRLNLNDVLKEGGRSSGSAAGSRLRRSLVVTEVALTLMLLVGAGLLVRSFVRLVDENPGFKPEDVLTFRISPSSKYRRADQRLAFYQQLIERLGGLPGVEAAGATTTLPFSGTDLSTAFSVEGRADLAANEQPRALFHSITPDYLRAMGIAITRGRSFTPQDNQQGQAVALVNETMAGRYWPGEDAVGQRIKATFGGERPLEIVGVVGDTRQAGLDAEVRPEIYLPFTQRTWAFMSFVVKTEGDPLALAGAVKSQVLMLDRDVPVYSLATLEQRMSDSVAKRRFNMILVGCFGFLALALAAVGIYGVLAYSVARRTHELGLRMALGADSRDIFKLVIFQGMTLTLAGLAAGLTGSLLLTRLISTLLFGVTATDPLTLAGVSVLRGALAFAACYITARMATRVDTMVALLYE
jgi:putative ABC transport system permease protein